MPEQPADKLRKRAEEVLGWCEGESNCFSLPTLTSFVREKAPKLHHELQCLIDSGAHILEPVVPKRRLR